MIFGEDGIADDQRNIVGDLTEEDALQILKAAFDLQYSWVKPIETVDGIQKLFRPFFSNNFIREFTDIAVVNEGDGFLPMYSISDDFSGLIPEYTNNPLDMELSEDGIYAKVSQNIERSFEGEAHTVTAKTILVKTKYGWKIDSFDYESDSFSDESDNKENLDIYRGGNQRQGTFFTKAVTYPYQFIDLKSCIPDNL